MMLSNKYINYIFIFFYLFAFLGCTKDEPSAIQKDSFIKSFGGPYEDEATDIISDNGNFFILGNVKDADNKISISLSKTNDFGNRIWEKTYSYNEKQTQGNQIIKLEKQKGFAIIGSVEMDNDTLFYDAYLLIVDQNGGVISENTFNHSHSEFGKCIAELNDGGFSISASQDTLNQTGSHMSLFYRLNPQGEIIPFSTSKTPSSNLFQICKKSNNEGFYATIYDKKSKIFILNPDGTSVGTIPMGEEKDQIIGITQDKNGDTYVCGKVFNGSNGNTDGFIAKLKDAENSYEYIWRKEFGENGNDILSYITISDENSILVTGSNENTQLGTSDIWVIKTDMLGNKLSEIKIGGDDDEYGVKILTSDNERFVVEATTYFKNNSMISIIKSEFK